MTNSVVDTVEPGYVTTPICMVQAAYVLMAERDKLPSRYLEIKHGINTSILCVLWSSNLYMP